MSDFTRLKVWEKAHALTLRTYAQVRTFPKEETYGLTAQLKRAAVSVGSNIAEGVGRGTPKEMAYFLRIAMGSVAEMRYQFLVARDLGWIGPNEHAELEVSVNEIRAMLDALKRSLEGRKGTSLHTPLPTPNSQL